MVETVASLFQSLGRKRIALKTGFSQQVLSRALVDNIMPAGWYPAIRDICDEADIECPEHLFRWASVKPDEHENPAA